MGTVSDIIWRVCPCCNVSLRYCSACETYACVHVFEAFLLEKGLAEERRPLPSFPAAQLTLRPKPISDRRYAADSPTARRLAV